jgi:hypothetical protein
LGAIKYTKKKSFKPMLRGGLMDTWEQYYTNKNILVIDEQHGTHMR